MKLASWILASIVLWTCPSVPALADDWSILVVGDNHADTLEARHPAWRRADRAVTQALINQGFQVYDKPALGMIPKCRGESCEGLSVGDFVALAREQERLQGQSIDLLVIYSLVAAEREGAAVTRWQVRLPGRMVDIETGRIVDQWDGEMREAVAPAAGCSGACFRQWLGDQARISGRALGAVLAEKLAVYVRKYPFRIELTDFTPAERDALTAALRAPADYARGDLRELGSGNRRREWLHSRVSAEYELVTPLRAGALRERIEAAASSASADASVVVRGNRLSVTREGIPYAGRYLAAVLLPLVAVLGFMAWARYSRFERDAEAVAERDSPSAGIAALERGPLPLLPPRGKWQALRDDWRKRLNEARKAVDEGRRALAQGEIDQAGECAERALAADAEYADAIALQQKVEARREAETLVDEALEILESDPSAASRLLSEAIARASAVEPRAQPALEQANARLRDTVVADHIDAAEQALAQDSALRAASRAGQGLAAIEGMTDFPEEKERLTEILKKAVSGLDGLTGNARAVAGLDNTRFLIEREIPIGRARTDVPNAISLNYKRASRLGKQAVIQRDGRRLFVVDRGSTHGTMLDEALLANGQPRRLADDVLIALGGDRDTARAGQVRLRVQISPYGSGSAVIRCDRFHLKLLDSAEMQQVWPSMGEDMARIWVLLHGPVPVYSDGKRLHLDSDEPTDCGFLIDYDEGYGVAPLPGSIDERVKVADEVLAARVPLAVGMRIDAGGVAFELERMES